MPNCLGPIHEKTTYGALQSHLAAVISHARGSEIKRPVLVVRKNCFQIIATDSIRKDDFVINKVTPYEINHGLQQNRWNMITTIAINFLKDRPKCKRNPLTKKEIEVSRQTLSQLTNVIECFSKSDSPKTPHTKSSAETETS